METLPSPQAILDLEERVLMGKRERIVMGCSAELDIFQFYHGNALRSNYIRIHIAHYLNKLQAFELTIFIHNLIIDVWIRTN